MTYLAAAVERCWPALGSAEAADGPGREERDTDPVFDTIHCLGQR